MTKIDYSIQNLRRTTLGECHLEHFEQSVRLGLFRKLGVMVEGIKVSREELGRIFQMYKSLKSNSTLLVMKCGDETLEEKLAKKILQTKDSEMFSIELAYIEWGN